MAEGSRGEAGWQAGERVRVARKPAAWEKWTSSQNVLQFPWTVSCLQLKGRRLVYVLGRNLICPIYPSFSFPVCFSQKSLKVLQLYFFISKSFCYCQCTLLDTELGNIRRGYNYLLIITMERSELVNKCTRLQHTFIISVYLLVFETFVECVEKLVGEFMHCSDFKSVCLLNIIMGKNAAYSSQFIQHADSVNQLFHLWF